MAILSTEAIVLRAYPFGDTSRIAVLLTREHGKVRVLAKGARAPRSRIGSALEPFAEIQAVYYEKAGRDLQLLKSADLLRGHMGFAEDPARLAFGSAALELSDLCLTGEESDPRFHALLADVLARMEGANRDRLGVLLASFELHAAEVLGYQAEFGACRGCGRGDAEVQYFSPSEGALVCASCAPRRDGLEPVSPGAVEWLRYLNGETAGEPAMENGDRSRLREAARLIQMFLAAHVPSFRALRSLDVLKRLDAAAAAAGKESPEP